jgi:hypothetical protein
MRIPDLRHVVWWAQGRSVLPQRGGGAEGAESEDSPEATGMAGVNAEGEGSDLKIDHGIH